MCRCDYGQCDAGVTGNCFCKCHISTYTEEAKAERQWWHDQLKKSKSKIILNLLKQRPL